MHHFFTAPENIRGGQILLTGGDVNHIRNVLRMEAGETVTVSDGQSDTLYICRIAAFEKDVVRADIVDSAKGKTELPVNISLFQGLPKSDKMEWIVQKAVELGVYEVIPVATRRAVVKLDQKKASARTKRWQSIAEGAAKQSGRIRIPCVRQAVDFETALSYAENLDVKLMPYELAGDMEKTRKLLNAVRPGQSVAILIGPEGGFEKSEVLRAQEAGFSPVTLGRRILRTETAGMAVLAALGFLLET